MARKGWMFRQTAHGIRANCSKRQVFGLLTVISCMYSLLYLGNYFAKDFDEFSYPLDIDLYEANENATRNPQLYPLPDRLNTNNFKVLIGPKAICRSNRDGELDPVGVLIIVKSQMTNFARRRAIRSTWGSPACMTFGDVRLRLLFLLAEETSDGNSLEQLHKEATVHGDILQLNFKEQYRHDTLKVMAALNFAVRNCSGAAFLTMLDDDFLLHPHNLVRLLSRITKTQYPIFIAGFVFHNLQPWRFPLAKWYLSYNEYPFEHFAAYPTGGSVFLSMPVAKLLSFGMMYTRYMFIGDAFMGIVLHKLGIKPINLPEVYLHKKPILSESSPMIASHNFGSSEKMLEGWRKLDPRTACPGTAYKFRVLS